MANLFGMTCDGRDIIATDFVIPEMEVGDWMVFGGMGAYTVGPKSGFNGMEATTKVEVWNGESLEMEQIMVREPLTLQMESQISLKE